MISVQLNDAALHFEPEVSQALGFGFRAGFLGLLHMDIVQERLEREYNMDLITTAPSVVYEVLLRNGEVIHVENPSKLPPVDKIAVRRQSCRQEAAWKDSPRESFQAASCRQDCRNS